MKLSFVFLTLSILSAFAAADDVPTSSDDTNPYAETEEVSEVIAPVAMVADPTVPITFSEFPLNTVITNQYAEEKGIVFGGDSPRITRDSARASSPVLAGPDFTGTITGTFVDERGRPSTVSSFSMDVGDLRDDGGTITLEWFDRSGNFLGSNTNSGGGIETMGATDSGIASWSITNLGSGDRYSIDNFISDPCDFRKRLRNFLCRNSISLPGNVTLPLVPLPGNVTLPVVPLPGNATGP